MGFFERGGLLDIFLKKIGAVEDPDDLKRRILGTAGSNIKLDRNRFDVTSDGITDKDREMYEASINRLVDATVGELDNVDLDKVKSARQAHNDLVNRLTELQKRAKIYGGITPNQDSEDLLNLAREKGRDKRERKKEEESRRKKIDNSKKPWYLKRYDD